MLYRTAIFFLYAVLTSLTAIHAEKSNHELLSERLIELTSPKADMKANFMASYDVVLRQMSQQGVPADKLAEVRVAAERVADKFVNDPELMQRLVRIQMKYFTEAETQQLIRFYQTPLGKKTITTMPKLFEEGAMVGEQVMSKYLPEFQKEIEAIMRAN